MLASLHSFRRVATWISGPSQAPDNAARLDLANTDGKTLMANALTFASAMKPCQGDLSGDGLVDDADFTLFVIYCSSLVGPAPTSPAMD